MFPTGAAHESAGDERWDKFCRFPYGFVHPWRPLRV